MASFVAGSNRGEMTRVVPAAGRAPSSSLRDAIFRQDDILMTQILTQVNAATLNATHGPGRTPLLVEVAATLRDPERLEDVLRRLVDRGANLAARDAQGTDALKALLSRRDQPLLAATLLLRRNAPVHEFATPALGALHLALLNWQGESLKIVLDMMLCRGADVHARTPGGRTPLWLAACVVDGAMCVRSLLQACPPQERAAMVQCVSTSGDSPRGSAGAAALLHQRDPGQVVAILAVLAGYGASAASACEQACAIMHTQTAGRSFQEIHDLSLSAARTPAEPRVGIVGMPGPMTQAPAAPRVLLTPPSQENAGPTFLIRPLPRPAVGVPSHLPGASRAAQMPTERVVAAPLMPQTPQRQPQHEPRAQPVGRANISDTERLDEPVLPALQKLFIANPEPASQPTQVVRPKTLPHAEFPAVIDAEAAARRRLFMRPTAQAVASALANNAIGAMNPAYETLSLHEAARVGPYEALCQLIERNPEALTVRDRRKNGGHMPLTLGVMSLESAHVTRILSGLDEAGHLRPEVLDAPGGDGRSALAVAIELNGQRQVRELLQAGASPLLPIPQEASGLLQQWGRKARRPASNAAECAVRMNRPYVLTLLLQWDEQDAAKRQSRVHHFAPDALLQLAQSKQVMGGTDALRSAIEDAKTRRRPPLRPTAVAARGRQN